MRKSIAIIILIIAAIAVLCYLYNKESNAPRRPKGPSVTVTFLKPQLGGGTIIQTPENTCTLIDPGPLHTAKALVDYLIEKEIGTMTVVITNPTYDRAGALEKLTESFEIRRIMHGELRSRSRKYSNAVRDGLKKGVSKIKLVEGNLIGLSKTTRLEVLSPPPGLLKNTSNSPDDNSLILKMRYKNKTFLFASDAGINTEGYLIQTGKNIKSDILAVGKHGKHGATSLELLSIVRPKHVVVSTGGSFGRPSRSVINRINPDYTGGKVYRTDYDGNVQIITDGISVAVDSEYPKDAR